jgi:N-acetylmuramoyl-L-alanine amidase
LTNRFIARTSSTAATAALVLLATIPARADAPLVALYQGETIRFTHVAQNSGRLAIGVQDPGFAALLHNAGAWLTWKPGERYVLITTSVPAVISFALGDRRYDAGPIALQAAFAPYERGNEVYLPFDEVLGALGLALRQDGNVKVLQPQLAALDVRESDGRVTLAAHGGGPLHLRVVQQSAAAMTYAFDGVGTTLSGTRKIGAGGVRSVQISVSGTVSEPTTLVTVRLETGATAQAPQNNGDRDVALSFSAASSGPQAVAEESPTPEPAPPEDNAPSASSAATVTGVTTEPNADGATVTITVNGSAIYEWHRLRDPDNRFWVDIKNAQLAGPPIELSTSSPIVSVRARQTDPSTVRIALSLDGSKPIEVTPSVTGLTLQVGGEDVADAPRSGGGSLGSLISASGPNAASPVTPVTPVTPAPADTSSGDLASPDENNWKFGPRSGYVPTNPRLIVIDPGHGGSDVGTQHGGLREADLTLDMAKRLRDILIARGWQVKLTRESDVDVYAPNDSARDELQARVDVANNAGARLFVSIHANAYINSGPYGTTCYISKPDDVAFARSVETHLAADGTKDDGVIKSHLYVTYHTRMPAVLVETAFLTNPSDYALLASAQWRQKVAQEIADGIGEYARAYPVPNQPAQ